MKRVLTELPEMKLVGITVRTNNTNEMQPTTAKIGPTVQQYMQDSVSSKIIHRKKSGTTFCVYTQYESDFTGEYTFFIGEEVTSFEGQKLELITIPVQAYSKHTTEPGVMPNVVIEAWHNIWQMSPLDLGGERQYIADFEIYDERAFDPKNTICDIYIGIQK